jgi:hypothetical protein
MKSQKTAVGRPSLERRFEMKRGRGGPDECWIWTAARDGSGYGNFWNGQTVVGAHRFAYEQSVGPVPPGQVVRHRCHTPACTNPRHLNLGTQKENLADAKERGTLRIGPGSRPRAPERTIVECWGMAILHHPKFEI